MTEIVSSEELRAFLLRLYAAKGDNDSDAVREMFSSSACLLNIGTDSDEWWTGPGGTEILLRQNEQLGGIELRPGAPVAYCVGNVGWIADRPRLVLRTGTEVGMRLTLVLAIERAH
jgi:hypothetical protein